MCYQPITIKTPQGYKQVPCGKCLECLRKYQQDWANRMYEELKAHDGKAVFFTLTYDDNNVPKNYLYYATPTDYAIFRSPSDYGYDNTYIDKKGREKVLPDRKGERKHKRVDPDVELRETGLDPKIIDFNVPRKEREKFRDTIQNIYGNYLRTFVDTMVYDTLRVDDYSDFSNRVFDFDDYGEDLFNFEDPLEADNSMVYEPLVDDEDEIQNMVDENGILAKDVISRCEALQPRFRERPVMMFNSVRKKDVQDWIKRGRQRRKRIAEKTGEPEQDFTFYITSEYGPRTLRPHYHGVLFGVSAEEAMDMCVDWQRHHGKRISWANVDLSKGDMSYCAKYCSKGFYEHPLCSKDFFYNHPVFSADGTLLRPFTEYHSKHYERCMEIFGIDAPIVDPTFHLISKGLGIKWVEDHIDEIHNYDVQLMDIDFDCPTATFAVCVEYAPWDPGFASCDSPVDAAGFKHKMIEINNKHIDTRQDYEDLFDRFFKQFKYFRTYKKEIVAYGVPKYYRAKVLSDGLRSAYTNYVLSLNDRLYKEKLDQLRADLSLGEDAEIVSLLERQALEERIARMTNCKKKLDRTYNKSKI